MLTQPKVKNFKNCVICGKLFRIRGLRADRGKYCSIECKRIGQRGIPTKGAPKTGKLIECKVCKKSFYVPNSQLKRKKYCSMKCRNSDKSFWTARTGKNHYAWNGGKTTVQGYIYIKSPDHPYKNHGGYVAEHRLVV